MIKRLKKYDNITSLIRKQFSESYKRKIACRQKYCCVGELCQGTKLLPETWELDHVDPLFKIIECRPNDSFEKITEYANREDNLCVLCSNCHALKSRNERMAFYEAERRHKIKNEIKDIEFLSSEYHYKKCKKKKQIKQKSPYFTGVTSKNLEALKKFFRKN